MSEIIASIFFSKWIILLFPLYIFLNLAILPFLLKGKFEKLRKVLYIINIVVTAYSFIMFIYFFYSIMSFSFFKLLHW